MSESVRLFSPQCVNAKKKTCVFFFFRTLTIDMNLIATRAVNINTTVQPIVGERERVVIRMVYF